MAILETLANTRAEQQQKLAVRTEEVLTKKKIGKQTVGKWLDAGAALESRGHAVCVQMVKLVLVLTK